MIYINELENIENEKNNILTTNSRTFRNNYTFLQIYLELSYKILNEIEE
jgi:hypothetical protein